jgi:hypothetical protein
MMQITLCQYRPGTTRGAMASAINKPALGASKKKISLQEETA